MDSLVMHALWWNAGEDRWAQIPWRDWEAFRRTAPAGKDGPLPWLDPGDHMFVVCVEDNGGIVNIISHRYMTGSGGVLLANVDGLTDQERADYDRIFLLEAPSAEDQRRLGELRDKWSEHLVIPSEALRRLMRDLPVPLDDDTSTAAWKFFAPAGVVPGPASVQ